MSAEIADKVPNKCLLAGELLRRLFGACQVDG